MFQTGSTAKPEVTVLAVSLKHSTATGTRIRVQPGDSLSTLARIHHTSVAAIRQLNHLTKDVISGRAGTCHADCRWLTYGAGALDDADTLRQATLLEVLTGMSQ